MTQSILIEDYAAMETLMKKFLLLAPSIQQNLIIETAEDLNLAMKFRVLSIEIQLHLES